MFHGTQTGEGGPVAPTGATVASDYLYVMEFAGDNGKILELGAIISGTEKFSRPTSAVTICDLTGTGAQDTAIAIEAFDRIKAAKLGTSL